MARVLLVENEHAVLDPIRHALKLAGYKVLSANSGESAIRVCHKASGIDVLIADAGLPGLTGFEIAAIVKSKHANVIVILMSGLPSYMFSQPIIAHEFLEMPFSHKDLLAAIFRHRIIRTQTSDAGKCESWN